jgi:hypothetical protein
LRKDKKGGMLKNRPLLVALSLSVLFHISMVTLFSIVFEFQVKRIDYYDFHILSEEQVFSEEAAQTPARRSAALPVLEDPLRKAELADLRLDDDGAEWASGLPTIELPRLEFAEMEMLELREESLTIRSRLAEFFDDPLREPWSRIGRGLERLGDALTLSRFFGREEETIIERGAPQLVARPAKGFEAYIEWMSEPRDRELLFSPPIEALFKVEPEDLTEPITLVFRVNSEGEVVEVLSPLPDEAGIVVSAARALTTYRFAPLEDGNSRDQHGTLLITGAQKTEGALP